MLVHNCPIYQLFKVFLVTHETQESVFPYFIQTINYVENWGTVFLSNALMFMKCPGVSISTDDQRNAPATFLKAVGDLILNIDISSLVVRIDCVAMKPEWWLFFSRMKNIFFCTQFSPQNEGTPGAALLPFFDLFFFFLGMPSRRLSKGKTCYNWMATLLLHDTHN